MKGKGDELWLNPTFQSNLRAVLMEKENNQFPQPIAQQFSSSDLLSNYSKDKWENVLLNLVGASSSKFPRSIMKLLIDSELMSFQSHAITNKGFQFLLQDKKSQLWTLLIQLFKNSPLELLSEIVAFVFKLGTMQLSRAYNFNPRLHEFMQDLDHLGIVLFDANNSIIFPTQSALLLHTENVESSGHVGYIILETNYRLYAYTSSKLDTAIIELFCNIKGTFANMIFGILTMESVKKAYSNGISSDQQNAHPMLRKQEFILHPAIIDQLKLWELDQNRMDPKEGYLYSQFLNLADFEKVVQFSRESGCLMYSNSTKRSLVVSLEGHQQVRSFVKANISVS